MKPTPEQTLWAELRLAHANVTKMRVALDSAATNAAHADSLERIARDELATLEAERAQLVAAAGDQLAAAIAQGIPDDVGVAHTAIDDAIRAAAVRLSIRMNAAAQLRAVHGAALNGLRVTETARSKAVDAIIYEHVERRVESLDQHMTAADAIGDEVRALIGTGLDVPVNVAQRIFTDRVRAVLARLPERDALYVPINEIRGAGLNPVDAWTAKRAQILSGLEENEVEKV